LALAMVHVVASSAAEDPRGRSAHTGSKLCEMSTISQHRFRSNRRFQTIERREAAIARVKLQNLELQCECAHLRQQIINWETWWAHVSGTACDDVSKFLGKWEICDSQVANKCDAEADEVPVGQECNKEPAAGVDMATSEAMENRVTESLDKRMDNIQEEFMEVASRLGTQEEACKTLRTNDSRICVPTVAADHFDVSVTVFTSSIDTGVNICSSEDQRGRDSKESMADQVHSKVLQVTGDTDLADECADCVLEWGLRVPESGLYYGNYEVIESMGFQVEWPPGWWDSDLGEDMDVEGGESEGGESVESEDGESSEDPGTVR